MRKGHTDPQETFAHPVCLSRFKSVNDCAELVKDNQPEHIQKERIGNQEIETVFSCSAHFRKKIFYCQIVGIGKRGEKERTIEGNNRIPTFDNSNNIVESFD